jgi:uncharacterized membrane protein
MPAEWMRGTCKTHRPLALRKSGAIYLCMQNLVTRFHVLLLTVTTAMAGVGFLRIPADFAFAVHRSHNTIDLFWPRDFALLAGPAVQLLLIGAFFFLGKTLTKNHFAKTQHILDPALTLALAVIAGVQLGLLFTGIGSDLDLIRFTALALGVAYLPLAVVFFEAERHTYAGMRMPWPVRSDFAWRAVHRLAGITIGLGAVSLFATVWFDPGIAVTLAVIGSVLIAPALIAAVATRSFDREPAQHQSR